MTIERIRFPHPERKEPRSVDPVLQTPPGSTDPNPALDDEIRRLLVIWQRSAGTKVVFYDLISKAIKRLLEISKVYDYDLGPTPMTGLSPKKWDAWRRNALPPDPRCPACRALGRGPHGPYCI